MACQILTLKSGGYAEAQDLRKDLARLIESAQDVADTLSERVLSRELSLAKTKLDEAQLWLSQVPSTPPHFQEAA